MKKFIVVLILFSSLLLSCSSTLIVKSYATNEDIGLDEIEAYASKFKIQSQEKKDDEFVIVLINSEDESTIKQSTTHAFNWIMIELDDNLSSGNYWVEHTNFEFTEHTLSSAQRLDKFTLFGRKIFSFHYDKNKDNKRYFLKTVNAQSHVVPMASLYTAQKFSKWAEDYSLKVLLSFFLFGIIFMAAIYNGALYLYNREKSFLYYMFMQFFMLGVLFYETDLIHTYVKGNIEHEEIAIFFYFLIVEVTMVFILLFIRSFLETEKHLPFQNKILKYIMIVAIIDLVLFFIPIMLIFSLYSFVLLYIIWIAWLRLKQGYKPALFFMFGWFALMLGVFLSEFLDKELFSFDPILIGSTVEALFLSMAISYKMGEIKDEKEEQKELLVHQSRLASMGDMLGNIAHQWRQPLARLGYILMNIESKDKAQLHTKKLEEASEQLEFMSQTIDDFKNFYKPNKKKEPFKLKEETEHVLALVNFKEIDIELKAEEETTVINYKNEYKQVILNLLNNAKEALIEKAIASPKIMIIIEKNSVQVSDNAEGIQLKNIQKIFEPYFSTKEQGLGIGLYMSKVIVEKNMGGHLEVKNGIDGAVFTIEFL